MKKEIKKDEQLEPINTDLKIEQEKFLLHKEDENFHYNVLLKKEIQVQEDYILISQKMWKKFLDNYPGGIEIKRYAYRDKFDNKSVEVVQKIVICIF